jgi:hypothetical protein
MSVTILLASMIAASPVTEDGTIRRFSGLDETGKPCAVAIRFEQNAPSAVVTTFNPDRVFPLREYQTWYTGVHVKEFESPVGNRARAQVTNIYIDDKGTFRVSFFDNTRLDQAPIEKACRIRGAGL